MATLTLKNIENWRDLLPGVDMEGAIAKRLGYTDLGWTPITYLVVGSKDGKRNALPRFTRDDRAALELPLAEDYAWILERQGENFCAQIARKSKTHPGSYVAFYEQCMSIISYADAICRAWLDSTD